MGTGKLEGNGLVQRLEDELDDELEDELGVDLEEELDDELEEELDNWGIIGVSVKLSSSELWIACRMSSCSLSC